MTTRNKKPKMPRPKSIGEETFALHLRSAGIPFEREFRANPDRRWRWDFAFVLPIGGWIVVDIQGGSFVGGGHNRGEGYQKDIDKHNDAYLNNAIPIWFTTKDVTSGRALAYMEVILATITKPEVVD